MTTRRERLRAATIQEIKQAALQQIADEGAPALSIRAVARTIGMSPAGLYRYYDGRDALLTDLITDAYTGLAEAVETAVTPTDGLSTRDRFLVGIEAYRAWAVAEPNRFLLIFGTPVPGYAAPEGGPTVAANRRIGEAFFRLAAESWMANELSPPAAAHDPTPGEQEVLAEIHQVAPDFPAALIPELMGAWSNWHGLVSLEVTNQLHWLYTDLDAFMRGRFVAIAERLGMAG